MNTERSAETSVSSLATSSSGLPRHFGLLQAIALNMSNMIGVGPFITIPILMSALGGPASMLGWLLALVIVICDGLIWSELGAAMPGSGGSYVYLRDGFGRLGRLMAFLFIWQFMLSGPLEIASGYIGFSKYLRYVFPNLTDAQTQLVAVAAGILTIILLYRRITHIGKLTVSLWIGTLLTTAIVIVTGAFHFNAQRAFEMPSEGWQFSWGMLMGLGLAARVGIYDYLGYYDICYVGDEVHNPGKVIPRSIIISVIAVAFRYMAINLSVNGIVSWREFVPADTAKPVSDYVVSVMMERAYGSRFASLFTLLILWTAIGSVFALLLGYSRIPWAAAQDGYFFRFFNHLHPRHQFPDYALLLIGIIAIVCSFFPLDDVINALLTTRILVQFIGQAVVVMLLRKTKPKLARPYRIWLFPLPVLMAIAGWVFLFVTSGTQPILFGVLTLAAGVICFFIWSGRNNAALKPDLHHSSD
jgi:amino acid transporter